MGAERLYAKIFKSHYDVLLYFDPWMQYLEVRLNVKYIGNKHTIFKKEVQKFKLCSQMRKATYNSTTW